MRVANEHPGNIGWAEAGLDRLKAMGRYKVNRTLSRPRAGIEYRPGMEREYSVGHFVYDATSTEEAARMALEATRKRHKSDGRWDVVTVTCKAPGQKTFRRTEKI
jgi:hypothetical protein